jgi:peptidyl-prolyl cis-trans isomerase SurA
MKSIIYSPFLFAFYITAFSSAAVASPDVIERVVAIVNDKPILLSELRRRAAVLVPQALQAPSEAERVKQVATLYREVLERIIDEQLIASTAESLSIRAEKEDEDRAIQSIQAQSGLSDAEFWEAVKEQGMSPWEYRQDIKRQVLRLKMLNQRVRGRIHISEEDIRQRYLDVSRQARNVEQYNVAHILIPIDAGSSPQEMQRRAALAKKVHSQATPQNFEKFTTTYGGGDLGWIKQGDLPEQLEATIRGLQPNHISQPVRGLSGFHIFLLRQIQQGGQIPSYEEVKQSIYRALVEQRMAREEQIFIKDLRRKAAIIKRL